MTRTRVKICCIASPVEARLAIAAGADAVGLVSEMPSGPGVISEIDIIRITAEIPPPVASVLLTSRTEPGAVATHVLSSGVNTVQLVDRVSEATYSALRQSAPFVRIIQVLHVLSEADVELAMRTAPSVDALLLDSGRPDAAQAELGGTGRTHDWEISRRIVQSCGVPVFLAGGLNDGNVAKAIRAVRPYGVDLCSGVWTDGALDSAKLSAFMSAVAGA
jgi:phosphoribosylanthranilate isomerase